MNDIIQPELSALLENDTQNISRLKDEFETLWEIDRHYSRKENLLFPFMEKYGITAPPKVMWGVDDEIRDAIKECRKLLADGGNRELIQKTAGEVINKVNEMIFKEENILFPMVLDTLTEEEWQKIAEESKEIGFCLIKTAGIYQPKQINIESAAKAEGEQPVSSGYVKFDAGIMLPEEINAMLNTLPVDITFVDKEGVVKYFSMTRDRIFPRPRTVIGRLVNNCHPPASVHIVEKIVEDFMEGRKDHEDFWIRMRDKFVYIRYFAVRNEKGEFLGTLEVTQDIKPIQDITGEKRLMSD